MSKKLYTEEQVQEKIDKAVREALDKVYQEEERREQMRYIDRRINALEDKCRGLEREIQELKGEQKPAKEPNEYPCNCVK